MLAEDYDEEAAKPFMLAAAQSEISIADAAAQLRKFME
jgi:hypothetical protein